MRVMVLIQATGRTEARVPASRENRLAREACLAAMDEAGVLAAAERLLPSASGVRLDYSASGEEPALECGPFPAESGLLAEYLVLETRSMKEAELWACRISALADGERMVIELRPLADRTDSPEPRRETGLELELADQLALLRHDGAS